MSHTPPSIVLICHASDPIDAEGLPAWLAHAFDLRGVVVIRDPAARTLRAVRREYRRSGLAGLADVLAFRAFYGITARREDRAWQQREAARLRARYPADLTAVPRLAVTDPNGPEALAFLRAQAPDLVLARCKVLLRAATLDVARRGTFVLHPGICPEYRNAHGCFWALAAGDRERVGMTLLRADRGVDTGPAYLQAGYAYDDRRESHIVIQYRVVLENLDRIAHTLAEICAGRAHPLDTAHRRSAVWGQPRLSAELARRRRWRTDASRRAAAS